MGQKIKPSQATLKDGEAPHHKGKRISKIRLNINILKYSLLSLFIWFANILVLDKYYTSIVCKENLSSREVLFSIAPCVGEKVLMRRLIF